MKKITSRDLYYTSDHEWIDFQGSVAYVGVCSFKLTGFKEIEQIIFNESPGFIKKGEAIAAVTYHHYRIEVHMPVDEKLMQVNDKIIAGDRNILLQQEEGNAWIALIVPTDIDEREGLLLPVEYHMKGRGKYPK